MSTKRTFREKLRDNQDFPRIQPLTGGMKKRWGSGTIVLPAPYEVPADVAGCASVRYLSG